ncbi:MAG: ParB/RepB/Spo0J family partition protein [Pseudomonadota bacterium]
MAEGRQKNRLGRGLAALIGESNTESEIVERTLGQRRIPIEFIAPNESNPRRNFDPEDLDDLAQSIRAKGVIQPIIVRPSVSTAQAYEIIAGERRWRAAQRAGLAEIPAIVSEFSDREAFEIAMIENVQRTDLTAIEEARGYKRLTDEFNYTQNELADAIGKSRSHVANTLRLLKLPDRVQSHIESGELSAGHARALVTASDPEAMAAEIINGGLSVRDVESMARDSQDAKSDDDKTSDSVTQPSSTAIDADPNLQALQNELSNTLGLGVKIDDKQGSGRVEIRYQTPEQLDQICQLLLAGVRETPPK